MDLVGLDRVGSGQVRSSRIASGGLKGLKALTARLGSSLPNPTRPDPTGEEVRSGPSTTDLSHEMAIAAGQSTGFTTKNEKKTRQNTFPPQ